MQYHRVFPGIFLERPNRFIARVELEGEVVISHVKNTGRCRELLRPGAQVYLEQADNPARKTGYDLIAVEKDTEWGRRLINMDAQAPNRVFQEWAEAGSFRPDLTLLRPETTWGNSRFDFYYEYLKNGQITRGFAEIKGVTLEEAGAVYFPDAPTLRGVKHVEELIACHKEGYEACIFFVVQMSGAAYFSPNDRTHPAFGTALRTAAASGVEIAARGCTVAPDALVLGEEITVML